MTILNVLATLFPRLSGDAGHRIFVLGLSLAFCAAYITDSTKAYAESPTSTVSRKDTVIAADLTDKTKTHEYNRKVLELALEKSVEGWGEYSLRSSGKSYSNNRALFALAAPSSELNVHITVTSPQREEDAIPIRIPIRFGVLSYRLLFINKSQAESFAKITTIDELLTKRPGIVSSWVTAEVYRAQHVKTVEAYETRSVFKMLNANRFDYISRGVNEIYNDQVDHGKKLSDIMIEPNLALYLPLPYYIFVSKREPKLAQRLEEGLENALADDSLKQLFWEYHADDISRALLDKRKVFVIENPVLPKETPLHRKELWYFHNPEFAQQNFSPVMEVKSPASIAPSSANH